MIHEILMRANLWKGQPIDSETYFTIGDLSEIVVSNSSVSWINPHEGGSFVRFEMFFEQQEETKYVGHIEKGRMLHRWLHKPGDFVVEDGRPSDAICEIMNALVMVYRNASDKPTNQGLITIFDQMREPLIEIAREMGWNSGWGEDAVFKNLKKGGETYFNFLLSSYDKFLVSPDVKESLDGMQQSIYNSEMRGHLLDDIKEPGVKVYKELALFVKIDGIWCKILIDNLIVNENTKTLIKTDIKTTGKPLSQFMGHRRFGLSETGEPINKYYDGSFQSYRYYRQIGFYDLVLFEILAQANLPDLYDWKIVNRLAVVETETPFECREIPISSQWTLPGKTEAMEGIDQVKHYLKSKDLYEE